MERATGIAKSIDASEGQHTSNRRCGLYDAASKHIISFREILAWIVKTCVPEAGDISVKELASQYIPADIRISVHPAFCEDAEA